MWHVTVTALCHNILASPNVQPTAACLISGKDSRKSYSKFIKTTFLPKRSLLKLPAIWQQLLSAPGFGH